MSRVLLALYSDAIRARAIRWCKIAPKGTIIEFREPKRTLEQNNKMWAMLTDISLQTKHPINGRYYNPNRWKIIFLDELGQESEWLPSLDGATYIPSGYSSSQLSKNEMSQMFELMYAFGVQNGVVFSHEQSQDDRQSAATSRHPQ